MQRQEAKARFIPPMLLQRVASLPEGPQWSYEVKLDGYRALAIKANGKVLLRSRNDKDFNSKYPGIAKALSVLPDETLIDGEVVALDATGRPSFNLLQNVGSSKATLVFYVFDLLVMGGKDVMQEPLSTRREILREQVLPRLKEPVRESAQLDASLPDLLSAVKEHGFEGRCRQARGQPLRAGPAFRGLAEIGGYTPSAKNFDAIIFGTTKAASSCMRPGRAVGLHRLRGHNSNAGSGCLKYRSVHLQICRRLMAAAGGRG